MSVELVATDVATEVPQSVDLVRRLDSRALYQLEQAGEIARDVLDERVAGWVGDGWTQQAIADETGMSQSAVDRRIHRLGLRTSSPRGRRNNPQRVNAGASEALDGFEDDEPDEADESQTPVPATGTVEAWTFHHDARRQRIRAALSEVDHLLEDASRPGLAVHAIARTLRNAERDLRQAIGLVSQLAFEFES